MELNDTTLIYDPVSFFGGSKVAIARVLEGEDKSRYVVLTSDQEFWANNGFKTIKLRCPALLADQNTGVLFFLKNAIFALQILFANILGLRLSTIVGISGPGVDYATYMASTVISVRLLQVVQGPVALSRSIGRCFLNAEKVFYLPSAFASIKQSMELVIDPVQCVYELATPGKYESFVNGLREEDLPTKCRPKSPKILWAASLLKWKGLSIFTEALSLLSNKALCANVCYIRPADNTLPVDQVPAESQTLRCFERPSNLDKIRSECGIFVSTSQSEPFGLSILEALAAGMCVVIPSDGAYWDRELIDGFDCRKYEPNDAADLASVLMLLSENPGEIHSIGLNGTRVAKQYDAKNTYSGIRNYLSGAL